MNRAGTYCYAILKRSMPESTTAEPKPDNIGNAIPTAFADGNFLYIKVSSGPGDDGSICAALFFLDAF
jgi:hypothetical protein